MSTDITTAMKETGDIAFTDMHLDESADESQIVKLFAGSTVLITGGTGFFGKLIIEKLLRSCPDLKKIYILARPKKNKEPAKRLQEQFEDVLYQRLKQEQPDFIRKVVVIDGDISQLKLGLTKEDIKTLIEEVNIIFHGAATVRFDEALKRAVEINVRGTRELLLLARSCTKLKALVHISTAFSNCPQYEIEEKIYDSPIPGEKLIDLVNTLDEKTLDNITPGLLGGYPNTYVYTKAVAEDIVKNYSNGLPVALFRPAVIVSTWKEPVPGWIDNVYGPTGVVVGAAVGLMHALQCRGRALADLVPADLVVSATLAAATRAARDPPPNAEAPRDAPTDHIPVYNFVSSVQRPLTWEKFMYYNETNGMRIPTIQAVWYYVLFLTPSWYLYNLVVLFFHWIPAYIVDTIAIIIGKKPMLRKTYSKIDKFAAVLAYFATRDWKFHNDNVQNLYKSLNATDKKLFDFDIGGLNWDDYFYDYIRGVRIYLIKDPLETVPQGITKYYRLKFIHYLCLTVLACLFLKLSWSFLRLLIGF